MGIPGYGWVTFRWVKEWFRFQSQIARQSNLAHLYLTETAYPDAAMNDIVATALKYDDWDYLQILEHDQIAPADWVSFVAELDPATHKVVGALTFGRAQEDQRPIPGHIAENGEYNRLSEDEVRAMCAAPGLYRVDAVGFGCSVIHRSVLENWNPEGRGKPVAGRHDWFIPGVQANGYLGHDIAFCMEAASQGHEIWVSSAHVSGHIGTFISSDETFLATIDHMRAKEAAEAARPRSLTILAGTE